MYVGFHFFIRCIFNNKDNFFCVRQIRYGKFHVRTECRGLRRTALILCLNDNVRAVCRCRDNACRILLVRLHIRRAALPKRIGVRLACAFHRQRLFARARRQGNGILIPLSALYALRGFAVDFQGFCRRIQLTFRRLTVCGYFRFNKQSVAVLQFQNAFCQLRSCFVHQRIILIINRLIENRYIQIVDVIVEVHTRSISRRPFVQQFFIYAKHIVIVHRIAIVHKAQACKRAVTAVIFPRVEQKSVAGTIGSSIGSIIRIDKIFCVVNARRLVKVNCPVQISVYFIFLFHPTRHARTEVEIVQMEGGIRVGRANASVCP